MRSSLALTLTGLILLAGCEGAAVPLGSPDPALFNEAALGSWVSDTGSSAEDEDRMYLRLFRFNEAEYYAEVRTDDDEPGDWMRLRIYPTDLEGVMFANIQCVGCDERDWLFFSYEMHADGRLDVTAVNDSFYEDDAAGITSTDALRSAATSRMAGGELFGETQTFVRWTGDPERE